MSTSLIKEVASIIDKVDSLDEALNYILDELSGVREILVLYLDELAESGEIMEDPMFYADVSILTHQVIQAVEICNNIIDIQCEE